MSLQARSIALSPDGDGIDLLQEAKQLEANIDHVRKSYQHFCGRVAEMVVVFVEQIISKSKGFQKGQQTNHKVEQ